MAGTLTGEEAMWSALAMTFLAGRLNRLTPSGQSSFAPRLVRLADALQPGCLLKVGARRLPISLLSPVNVVSADDTHWGIMALMLLAKQIREQEPMWAPIFYSVAATVRRNSTVRIANLRRPISPVKSVVLARDFWELVERSDIIKAELGVIGRRGGRRTVFDQPIRAHRRSWFHRA